MKTLPGYQLKLIQSPTHKPPRYTAVLLYGAQPLMLRISDNPHKLQSYAGALMARHANTLRNKERRGR